VAKHESREQPNVESGRQSDRARLDRPALDVVQRTVALLAEDGILAALGGSGLLAALGLSDQVRDWDLTTDAHPALVRAALTRAKVRFSSAAAGEGGFATQARFRVDGGDHDVDLIVGFALRSGAEVVTLPTRVTGQWCGLPLGDPEVWALAYRLMGRHRQAAILRTYLDQHS
jgi:hypothetical protein